MDQFSQLIQKKAHEETLEEHLTESEQRWKNFDQQLALINNKLHAISNFLIFLEDRSAEQAAYTSLIEQQLIELKSKVDELLECVKSSNGQ